MYEMLQSPGKIGSLTLKNRVVMTAARSLLSDEAGTMTEDMIRYYQRRALGGVGLIITEAVYVDEIHGVSVPKEMPATRDSCIPEFQKLADRVHPYGTKIFAQLFHPGANGDASLSPGGLISADQAMGGKHGGARRATREEIMSVVDAFGQAALRVKKGGFDGVEIHGAHNYLLQSFLSPATNHRNDEFGGSLENRCRILRLIVEAIRKTCGEDFPLMARISVEEYIGTGGYHADEGIRICQLLEQWGVDAIDVTAGGTSSKLSQSMEPITYPQGWRKHLMKAVKKSVSIPVCGVALVRDPAFAEELLREGYTDFVGSVRAHLADPDWTNKALSGREGEITPCISCMSCLEMEYKIGRLSCALNPETGFEAQIPPLKEDGDGRLVIVLGGGAAGMEGAWIAARRGFRVKLYEKRQTLGGQMILAGKVPRKEKVQLAIDSLIQRCRESGVELLLGTAPTIGELKAQAPYAVLDATGGKTLMPASIQGAGDSPLACTPEDVISGKLDIRGESVVVVGSGMTGLETAELLSERERNNAVVILEAAEKIAPGSLGSNRNVVTGLLELNQVVFMPGRKLTRVGEDRVYFENSKTGEPYQYPCDRVVLAIGVAAENPYGDALGEVCDQVIRIGDAKTSGKIWHAVRDGYLAALEL